MTCLEVDNGVATLTCLPSEGALELPQLRQNGIQFMSICIRKTGVSKARLVQNTNHGLWLILKHSAINFLAGLHLFHGQLCEQKKRKT